MTDFAKFQEPVWDRFFDFIGDANEDLSASQVDEELRRRNIDTTKAFRKLQLAVESAKARAELEKAKRCRPGLLEQVRSLADSVAECSIEEVRRLIAQRPGGHLRAAYFRRLESAATPDDLRSLAEDIHRLEILEGGPDDAGAEAE